VSAAASRGKSLLAAARSEAKDVQMQHATLLRTYQSLQAAHSSINEQVDQVLIKSMVVFQVCDQPCSALGLEMLLLCKHTILLKVILEMIDTLQQISVTERRKENEAGCAEGDATC
jgi:hypothetical protein